ncbi:MAG: hypothetical protein IPP71_00625 [Bacteroidetes bacterium]|nr:hypothetical protein [Bacteroidota bacterium]
MLNKICALPKISGFLLAVAEAVFILIAPAPVTAQTYAPTRYWTFERSNPMLDSMNNFNMDPNYYQSPYTINTNAANVGVGKYMTLNNSSSMIKLGQFLIDTTITVEFLFRPGYLFNMTSFFKRIDGAFEAQMGYPYISFYTNTNNYSGGTTFDELRVDLSQIGKRSYGYFMDGNWHHIVFSYNSKTGVKKIYIDGDCPDGYSKTITTGYFINNTSVNRDVILNSQAPYLKYHGDIDEIAYYNYILPPNQIYKHYQDFTQKKHFTFAASSTPAPSPAPVTAGLDMNEFAPGHPSVSVSVIDQLSQYPAPRYKPGNTLMKNFNWMDPAYMGGLFQPGVTTTQAVINSTIIQTELAKNFNYLFNVGYSGNQFDTAWTGAANNNPTFKLGMRVFRAQLNGNSPELVSQTKASNHYLQNSSGQFLDLNGNVTSNKLWRPTAPTSSYSADGNSILSGLNYLFTRLNRGVDLINENGEVFPFITETAMLKDPVVTAAKNASGLDWQTFLATKFKENETASFRDVFMSHPRMTNSKFTEFAIDGYPPLYGFKYSEARKVNPVGRKLEKLDHSMAWMAMDC